MTDPAANLSTLERDALQEIMNIAFGRAAADLADVMQLYVTLTVPYIDVLREREVFHCIDKEIPRPHPMSMITQVFTGRFSGSSVLIFPLGDGKKLLHLFEDVSGGHDLGAFDVDQLETESLLEISNIIMGACVSKIAELLGDAVTFSPPRYFPDDHIHKTLEGMFDDRDSFAIFFKTIFHFEEFDASGFLFLVSDYSTLDWLRTAIADYIGHYA